MWSTAIAVAGTLLAALGTLVLQDRAARRQQHRQNILTAATDLAGVLMDMRGLQDARWEARANHAPAEEYAAARAAALEVRKAAGRHLFQLKTLTVRHPGINALATQLVDATFTLHDAVDQTALTVQHQRATALNDELAAAVGRMAR